jgi:multidrug efflux pump
MRLSELSVRRPVFAAVLSLLLVILGFVSLERLPLREFPDINRPVVTISTRYLGASTQVVETKVTQVIEDSIAGIEGVLKIESDSEDEASQVRIEFDIERDIDAAANDVRDRVARVVGSLPPEADPPEVLKADANAEPVVILAFNSSAMSSLEVTDYADRNLVDRFATVPGVARVTIIGARRYAMRVWLNRQALASRQLTVTDIEDALRRENVQLPAGRLESETREFSLRTEVGLSSEQDFRNLVISRTPDGHLVRLGEIADVRLAAENERTLLRTNGRAGVGLSIEAQSKANTLDVVRGVRAEVQRLKQSLPSGAALDINVDNGIAIEAALREIILAVGFAFVLVLAVIYAFLGSLRATLIPAVTIPVSLIASFTLMYALGYSVNVLTLLGLVLAVGLVVDDSIVVLENIHRRAEQGEPPLVAAVTGSREIGFAVIATTVVLVAVFVPISFLPGDIGRLFREFGFTLAGAVIFSSVVALTLTPMMASKMRITHSERDRFANAINRFFLRFEAKYETWVRAVLRRPGWLLAAVGVLAAVGLWMFRGLPSEFTPSADGARVFVTIEGPEGATFDLMEGYGRQVEQIVLREMEKGDIERVTVRVPGAFGTGGGAGDVNSARAIIVLKDWSQRERTSREIGQAIAAQVRKIPGIRAAAFSPSALGRRGGSQPVEAVLGGPEYEQIAEWSEKLLQLASENPGLVDPETSWKERKPQIRVAINRDRAAELGVSLQSIGRTLETMLGSRIVTTYIDRGREYNVVLQARDAERASPTDLENINVRSQRTGEMVALANVVRLVETSGAMELSRFDRLRAIEISSGLAPDYSMGEAIDWFRETVAKELPGEAVLMWDGESGDYLRSGGALLFTFVFALAIVYLVLAAQFESFVHPAIIMFTVPLALLGAVLGLKISGLSVNIFSEIAVIVLIGIAAKNGVLIVEFTNQLRDRGLEFSEAIVKAAGTRLRPVLMTSLCTAFGALPFMFATGAGAEQRIPIGVVVFYGTVFSMFLTLLVVPAAYSLLARKTRSPEHVSRILDKLLGNRSAPAETPPPSASTPSSTTPS